MAEGQIVAALASRCGNPSEKIRHSLLRGRLLESFDPIDGPEVMSQVLLSDVGVRHVEVALVSPTFAPGIAHLSRVKL